MRKLLGIGLAVLAAAVGFAQETKTYTIEVDAGYLWNYRPGKPDDNFHRIAYKGEPVSERGKAFSTMKPYRVNTGGGKGEGDVSKLQLRYEAGTLVLGGSIFEAYGLEPLSLRGIDRYNVRGSLFLASNDGSDQLKIAGGLESGPIRIPGFADSEWTNYLVLGAGAEHDDSSDTDEDRTFGIATVRGFLGNSFGWRKDKVALDGLQKDLADLIAEPNLYDNMEKYRAARAKPVGDRSEAEVLLVQAVQQFFATRPATDANGGPVDLVTAPPPAPWVEKYQDEWVEFISQFAPAYVRSFTERPTWVLYAEGVAWYEFGKRRLDDKVRGLFTATAEWWLLPSRDDVTLKLRYEHGYERAATMEKKNHLMLIVGIRL
jgi:hypothetical protein